MNTAGNVADISRIFSNTNAAACGGLITAMILTQLLYKKVDLTMVLNGALAGLVSITAEPLTPSLGAATLIGAVGGIIVVFTVPMLDRMKIDDVVGAIPVHLFAGIWGTIAVILTSLAWKLILTSRKRHRKFSLVGYLATNFIRRAPCSPVFCCS